ncbi:Myosin-1 [Bienertia sinuspersici]
MAIVEDNNPAIIDLTNQNQSPKKVEEGVIVSQASCSHAEAKDEVSPKKIVTPKDSILTVASKIAAQALPCSDPEVWGVLTAISNNARKRSQGINILLTADEHCIGRVVGDVRFQIDSNAVSQRHCAISRKRVPKEDVENPSGFCYGSFLKDTSTNGTFLNWEKLKRGSSKFEAKLRHGDIVSLAAPPQHEQAFAFVYREVLSSVHSSDGTVSKRKAEEFGPENKRLKGIGIGAPEGPVSLDDFRSLQHSNTELRKQLEIHVLTIDGLRNENREALELHKNEMKELRESVSKSYNDQLNDLNESLEITKKELTEANKSSAEQKHANEELSERLSTALQSCTEANEIMKSQKASIAELKTQLDEERDQRREEREKAAADLKASIQRIQSEAEEELKRVSDVASRREREQQEFITKLQESERENSALVESLRSKLEEHRQKLFFSDNRVRQLEAQVSDEQQSSACSKKRVEELEMETRRIKRDLDKEKQAAREEAWAKASALELEINAAMRDLEYERRRLKGARERIMLRETQLRAFYSTTEEIKALFTKQQEQLKSMQKALQDDENEDNASFDLNTAAENADGNEAIGYRSNAAADAGHNTSTKMVERGGAAETSSEECSATEKHDCDIKSQDDDNTQEAEFPKDEAMVKDGFGSDIDGVGTSPINEGDADGTERVQETESPGIDTERKMDLNKSDDLAGDTMQLEDTNVQETEPQVPQTHEDDLHHSQASHRKEVMKATGEAEPGALITTEDLLASEVAGSWAFDTEPSLYGDNESPHNNDRKNHVVTNDSNAQAEESQNTPSVAPATRMHSDHEIQALSNMIGIMAPDVKDQFKSVVHSDPRKEIDKVFNSDSETDDECVEASKDVGDADDESESGDETQADDQVDKYGDDMDVDDEATAEDSVG